eukprot:Nitzschia sp. Nitz4//scaffold207_size38617//15320//18766//NITZ4_007677-RA/size38617-exonerate_est2genome-gene-0.48-mRNA-1//1//CDS//3329541611//5005//frame0
MTFDTSLLEEVQTLRKRVVALETAEADKEKLRKELSRLKVSTQEEKSQMEMDFMNQLTGVARENSLRLEELEGRLAESNKVNRALNDQLQLAPTMEMMDSRIRAVQADHRTEMNQVVEANKLELGRTRQQLDAVMSSRDELSDELEEANDRLQQQEQEIQSLKSRTSGTDSLQKLLKQAHEENATLQSKLRKLEDEMEHKSSTYQTQIQILEERLHARDVELTEKSDKISQLEAQAVPSKPEYNSEQVNSLEQENVKLKVAVQKIEMEKKQQDLAVMRLERSNQDLTKKCKLLEEEKKEDDSAAAKTPRDRKSWGGPVTTGLDSLNAEDDLPEVPSVNRTTHIIRQLEQNLKKEGEAKQVQTAGLRAKKRMDAEAEGLPEPSDGSVQGMRDEILMLRSKLAFEVKVSSELRTEVSELRASSQAKNNPTKIPSFSGRSISQPSPARRSSVGSTAKSPRTPVRGLVQSFEKKISQNTQKPMLDVFLFDPNDVDALKEALHNERQQVFELEDELTRQCEINCALLKEISSLTTDTETSRNNQALAYNSANSGDQKVQFEKLSNEVTKLKQDLADVEESKTHLSSQFEKVAESDRQEIKRLESSLSALRVKLAEAETNRQALVQKSESHQAELEELQTLRSNLKLLEEKLATAETELARLRQEKDTDLVEIEKQYKEVKNIEQRLHAQNLQVTEQQRRIVELQSEVESLRETQKGDQARKLEIDRLNSVVSTLQSKVTNSTAVEEALYKEKEAGNRLQTVVQTLETDLRKSEELVQSLTTELSESKVSGDKVVSLTSKVDELSEELKRVSEERDELEEKERIHFEKFDQIRSEIDTKIGEFERVRLADKEEISRLHAQVKSLEGELHESLENVDRLSRSLKEKEEVEETVEQLQRENQQSLDSQITKLQKELTQSHLSEAEAKKQESEAKRKVDILNDRIHGLESEIERLKASKSWDAEQAQIAVAEKEGIIARLNNEKEQLVLSMNDMTKFRRKEVDELQTELMEMSTRAANQAREVQALKIQLDESEYKKEEMERLRVRIRQLSDQLAKVGSSRADDEKSAELQLENSELRQRLRDTSMALKGAEDKMRELVAEKGGSSKSMQVLRERNATLKFEVEKLTKKLRKLAERKQIDATEKVQLDNVEAVRFMI